MAEFVQIKGKVNWFKYLKPEEYKGKETWSHVIYPDQESLDKIRDLQAQGMKNVLKKDEDGYHIKFSRPSKLMVRGEWKQLEPPLVLATDGKTQITDPVGNGSDVTTKLEVYEHNVPGSAKKAKAARWLSSRVDNLVPIRQGYDKEQFFSKGEERAAKGLEQGWE